ADLHRPCVAASRPFTVIGEGEQVAGTLELVLAAGADGEGLAAPHLADQAEPVVLGLARVDVEDVEGEVAIAVGAAGDKGVAPSALGGEAPGLSGLHPPEQDGRAAGR